MIILKWICSLPHRASKILWCARNAGMFLEIPRLYNSLTISRIFYIGDFKESQTWKLHYLLAIIVASWSSRKEVVREQLSRTLEEFQTQNPRSSDWFHTGAETESAGLFTRRHGCVCCGTQVWQECVGMCPASMPSRSGRRRSGQQHLLAHLHLPRSPAMCWFLKGFF